MPPKPSKWMINKTNLALPSNKGFHSGNFSPGNHFHLGHSWWHMGSFPTLPLSCACRGSQRCHPTLSCSPRTQIPPCMKISLCKSLWEHALAPSPLRMGRSPRDTERWLLGCAAVTSTDTTPALGWQWGPAQGSQTHPEQTRLMPWRGKKKLQNKSKGKGKWKKDEDAEINPTRHSGG